MAGDEDDKKTGGAQRSAGGSRSTWSDEASARDKLLSRLARRIQNPRELGGDALELMGAVLETSDRAKTEMVRMVAREVRNYLDELRLGDDLKELVNNYSLEVKMSLSLKPLAESGAPAATPPTPSEPEDEG